MRRQRSTRSQMGKRCVLYVLTFTAPLTSADVKHKQEAHKRRAKETKKVEARMILKTGSNASVGKGSTRVARVCVCVENVKSSFQKAP